MATYEDILCLATQKPRSFAVLGTMSNFVSRIIVAIGHTIAIQFVMLIKNEFLTEMGVFRYFALTC